MDVEFLSAAAETAKIWARRSPSGLSSHQVLARCADGLLSLALVQAKNFVRGYCGCQVCPTLRPRSWLLGKLADRPDKGRIRRYRTQPPFCPFRMLTRIPRIPLPPLFNLIHLQAGDREARGAKVEGIPSNPQLGNRLTQKYCNNKMINETSYMRNFRQPYTYGR